MNPIDYEIIADGLRSFKNSTLTPKPEPEKWDDNYGIIRTKPANLWMKLQNGKPAPRRLFGSFWFEDELCILFADTNLGKSVLAVQIADSLTRNGTIANFNNDIAECASVLYIDFEQSAKQFWARYSDRWGGHLFAEHFYRSEFDHEASDPAMFEDYNAYLQKAISRDVEKTKARVLIIDNITYMGFSGTERARDAMPLMKTLKALKTKHNLSMLVLAHTPKRNPGKPLTVNDLQGSKMLINFADSALAIGKSHTEPGLHYLKQIKQRSSVGEYGEANVCLCRIQKDDNFLKFDFIGHGHEHDHLQRAANFRKTRQQRVLQLYQSGLSCRQIATQLSIHFSTVSRMIHRMPNNENEEEIIEHSDNSPARDGTT